MSGTSEWTTADAPTEKSLDAVVTTTEGPVAVGAAGNVVARGDGEWTTLVDDGPAARRNALTDAAVSADGERVWFCGSSGALGVYDVTTDTKYDYTAPGEKTSTWEAIAVAGEAGSERLYVANGSGEVLTATVDADCCPTFGDVVKPGSGSTITALAVDADAYAVDTSGNVFRHRADEWTTVGIPNAQVNFFDVVATDGRVTVSAGGGLVYRYDADCDNWTPVRAGEGALYAIDADSDRRTVAGAGGNVFEHDGTGGWGASPTPVEAPLYGVTLGSVDVAVGANGVVIERA
jgi:hypothetical protein